LLVASSNYSFALDGTWTLYPPQTTIYKTTVQQPINADGTSNFKSNGKAVIPIKFSLAKGAGPVVFQSIGSDQDTTNDYSYLSFRPSISLLFSDLGSVSANYAFTEGNCHGGSLRWSVTVEMTPGVFKSVFVYYGSEPDTVECITGGPETNQSGLNLLSYSDLRFDTGQVGGTFYDTYANALTLVGSKRVTGVSLVLDSGWGGDQKLTPSNVTVNQNTFVPAPAGSTSTCNLPPATIQITKVSGSASGGVNEPISIQSQDDDGNFRVVDCKYMYNLATSSLSGVGRYRVQVMINGDPVSGAAEFDLR
jgi:hypothetical protein